MPRGLMFRRIVAGILILLFVATAIYSAADEFDKPIPLMIAAILGIAVLIEPISIIWDRFVPDASTRRRKPSADAVRDADTYLEGRLRQFAAESQLFVELAGDTIIQTTFSSEAHQFEDIQKAVELHKGRFVLIGEPGAGKSTTLRQLMIQAIRDYRLKTNPRLPVWINLGLSGTPINADDLLQFWWDEQAYLPGTPDQHIKNDAVWFFMDGLNEMPLDSREERAQALKAFLDKHPTLPVIVTCRVRDYEDDEKLNLGLPIVRVHELDEGRIQEFITKRGASADLWDKIRSNDALRRMADNPYKLVMLIAVYQARHELPERLDELYGLYVTEAYRTYKDEREKQENTPLLRLTWPKLETRLKRLAFLMIKDGKGTAASVDWARHKIGKPGLTDGINLGVLLVDGEDVRFYHQSLHGFFAAEKLRNELRPMRKSKRQLQSLNSISLQNLDCSNYKNSKPGTMGTIIMVLSRSNIGNRLLFLLDPIFNRMFRGDTDRFERIIAQIADMEFVPSLVVDSLLPWLSHPRWSIRWITISALRKIQGIEAVAGLLQGLEDVHPSIRVHAALGLGECYSENAIPVLIGLLSDDAEGHSLAVDFGGYLLPFDQIPVCEAAAQALRKIGTPEALAAVEKWEREQKSGG